MIAQKKYRVKWMRTFPCLAQPILKMGTGIFSFYGEIACCQKKLNYRMIKLDC